MKTVLFLCALVTAGWATTASAIPLAGHYAFTAVTWDPIEYEGQSVAPRTLTIAGTFVSTGHSLATWNFSGTAWGPAVGADWSFAKATDSRLLSNTDALFKTSTGDPLSGYSGGMAWNPDPTILTARFGMHVTCCEAAYGRLDIPTVHFARTGNAVVRTTASVPEPSTWLLVVVGLLGLVGVAHWTKGVPARA